MSKVRIELNSPGIRALLRSPEMQAVLKSRADTVKDRCGDGYESYVAQTRAVAVVETASQNAYDDNSANNTLLKAVSSSRSGAVVHEHKRHLKDGRAITVRNSFTRPHWRCSPTAAAGVLPADRLPQRRAVRRDAV